MKQAYLGPTPEPCSVSPPHEAQPVFAQALKSTSGDQIVGIRRKELGDGVDDFVADKSPHVQQDSTEFNRQVPCH
jgi:hypothetical protein